MKLIDSNKRMLIKMLNAGIRNIPFTIDCDCNVNFMDLVLEAQKQRVIALIYRPLLQASNKVRVSEELLKYLRETVLKEAFVLESQYTMFGEVLQKLTHYNIPIVALKGLVLRDFYPDKWMRYMSDFDLLVRESDMSQIDSILKKFGYISRHDDFEESQYEHRILPKLDIHTQLVSPLIEFDESFRFTDEAWHRTEPIVISGVEVRKLRPIDNLIFLIMHMANHALIGGIDLRQLCDMVLFVEEYFEKIDWREFLESVKSMNILDFTTSLFLVCKTLFNLKTPEILSICNAVDDDVITELLDDMFSSGAYHFSSNERIAANLLLLYSANKPVDTNQKWFSKFISAVFPKAEMMGRKYSYARMYKILLPVAWIHRIIYCIFRRDYKTSEKIALFKPSTAGLSNDRSNLLKKLGLLR